MLVVSISAMLFDIYPVIATALLSAFIWNFFFIPPTFTLHIGTPEDALMFLMYFVIALINIVLSFKIREFEEKAREKEERENTIKLYNSLLNSLSHEIRTPISTIIGSIDVINDSENLLSENTKKELLNEIEISGLRLNRLVDNLLNMSRLESGFLQLKLDWCDVNEMIYAVIHHNTENALHHHIHFNTNDNLPLFKIDRGLIEQVIHNIIYNALQYTPQNSIINIAIFHEPNTLKIEISDNGKGFPEKEIEYVFNKFYRLPNSVSGGTGLGLSIAKGFVEAHLGKISLKNIETGGARFLIEIPAETSLLIEDTHE